MTKIKNSRNRYIKYIGISLISAVFIFIFTFLLNPVIFIKDIEARITDLVESESGMRLEYTNFSGNFFKGFTLESPILTFNSNTISDVKILKVYPGLFTSFFSNKLRLNKLKLLDGLVNLDNFTFKNNPKAQTEIQIKLLELEDITIQLNNQNYQINSKLEIDIGEENKIYFISGLCELPIWPFEIEIDNGEVKISSSHYYMSDLVINSNFGQIEINGEFKKENLLNSFANISLSNLKLDYYLNNSFEIDNLNIMFETISKDSSIAKLNGNANIENLEIDNYQIDLGIIKNKLYINSSEITYDDSRINLIGIYDLNTENIDLASRLNNIEFPFEFENNFNGVVNLIGSIYSDSLKIDLGLTNSNINDFILNELNGEFLYKDGFFNNLKLINVVNENVNIQLDNFNYTIDDNLIEATGDFNFNNLNYSSDYLNNQFDLEINGNFNGKIVKENESLSVLGITNFVDSKFNNNIINLFSSEINYFKNKNNLSVSINGNAKLKKTDYDNYLKLDSLSFSVNNSLDKTHIYYLNGFNDNIPKFLGKDIEILANEFSTKEVFLNYNEVDVLSDKVLAYKNNKIWKVNNHPLYLNNEKIIISSKYEDIQNFEIYAETDELNFSSINAILKIPQRLVGQYSGELNITKSNNDFEINTHANMLNGKFDEMVFDSLLYSINWTNKNINYNDVKYYYGNQVLSISGEHFPNNNFEENYRYGNINLFGKAKKIDLNSLNNFIPISMDIGGFYTGDFEIGGTPDSPKLEINVIIDEPIFDLIQGEHLTGKIYYENETSKLEDLYLQTQNGSYTGEGYVPVNLNIFGKKSDYYINPNLDFTFDGQTTEFEFLTPYFDIIDSINGQIILNMNISGNLSQPIRNGSIEIKQAKLNLMPLENTIYGINGFAQLINNNLKIDNLYGLTGQNIESSRIQKISNYFKFIFSRKDQKQDNLITASGEIELSQFFNPKFNINISSDDLFISSINESYKGNAITSFNITGKDTIFINGEFKPVANKFTFLMEFEEEEELNNEKISKGKVLAYDIQIPLENGVKIENSQMDGLIDGDINLSAVGNEPFTFSGNINVVDGSFYFNGNTIDQISGNILLDPAELEPVIDFTGITNVAGKDIELSLNGKMDNPNLSLESISDPELTQDDLLYLLVFTPDSVSQSDGIIGTEQVGNLITNYVETTLERNIVRNSLLDKFQFNTQGGTLLSGFENSHLNLYLGKNISPNLYLNLKSDLNTEHSTFQYEVGYRLSRNMSIIGRIDEKQLYHLTYRFKYKY